MSLFVIKDEDGNYVSEMSVGRLNKEGTEWSYSCYTGKCAGMRIYPTRYHASSVVFALNGKSKKIGIDSHLEVVGINCIHDLPHGEAVRRIIHI